MLQPTEYLMLMITAMEECDDFININGGFTVVGWYKRFVINNKSLISARNINSDGSSGGNTNFNSTEEDIQFDLGGIIYHIVSISLSNREYLGPNNLYGI